jgi:hypothetical protein
VYAEGSSSSVPGTNYIPLQEMGRQQALCTWVEVRFEELVYFLAVVFWIAHESPRLEFAVADVVDNTSVVLVVEFLWWFTEPLLDMFGIWSFGCIALRDPYDR